MGAAWWQVILTAGVALAAVFVNVISVSVIWTWRFAQQKALIEEKIETKSKELTTIIEEKQESFYRRMEVDRRDIRETFDGFRSKIQLLELDVERNFLRKTDLTPVVEGLKLSMEGWVKRLEDAIEKLDKKIESRIAKPPQIG